MQAINFSLRQFPLLIAALLLLLGGGIALYILETNYLPRLGLSLQEMHMTLEQYEAALSDFEVFLWVYLGAVGTALLLTIFFTNVYLTRSLFRHISEPLDELVAGVERIQQGDLDSPIAYTGGDEFKAACDAVDLMAAKLKAALEDEQRRTQSRKELIAGMSHDLKSPLTSIRAYSEALRDGVAATPELRQRYIETVCRKEQEIEGMVNRLFEFSKLDLSELPLDMHTVDAKATVDTVAADYTAATDIDTAALAGYTVLADESQLRRIAKNIIDNAVKYSGHERVRIAISAAAEGARGLRGAWSFGPALLDADGRAKTEFVTTVAEANPRTAVGCYEPGHYCFVAVDGRGMEGSAGMTMAELAALFEALGCKTAYNLDGGQSSVMAWDEGRVTVNAPANGGRPVSDIIYIPKE